jgi:aspartate kinase
MKKGIVAKFGGSSVKDGEAMLRCSHILEDNPLIRLTIISATYNTTNQLEMVAKTALLGDHEILKNVILEIEKKHLNIARELFSSQIVLDELKKLVDEIEHLGAPKLMDQLYGIGERMSSLIFSDLLKMRLPKNKIIFLDARKIIKTNSDFTKAQPQIDIIKQEANKYLIPLLNDEKNIVVTQGFIGENLVGESTTLGREGSDYSAALFGEAIDASLIQIWTDVDGVKTCDPRTISNTKSIEHLSYDEATALATLGAKVLYPRTLLPAQRSSIPVFVGSSLNPKAVGTIIDTKMNNHFLIKAVTHLKEGPDDFISFIGSHLDQKENLVSLIQNKFSNHSAHFHFHDYTQVSITFKLSGIEVKEALSIAHEICLSGV